MTVKHQGFSEEKLRDIFVQAGCEPESFGVSILPEEIAFGEGEKAQKRRVFLARARKGEA